MLHCLRSEPLPDSTFHVTASSVDSFHKFLSARSSKAEWFSVWCVMSSSIGLALAQEPLLPVFADEDSPADGRICIVLVAHQLGQGQEPGA
jgi:hypothetical protein